MANIASSTFTAGSPEIDGRTWVHETHVDVAGLSHAVTYLAPRDADMAGALAAHAASLGNDLQSAEIAANVAQVLDQGAEAVMTFAYSTIDETIAAGLSAFPGATPVQAIMLGDWLQAQTNENLQTWFGLSADQVAAIQALPTLASQVAALAVLVAQVSA